ncbi:MAG: ribonuclease P protein component [Acidimicrobiia bacterium]|nr:ribonuclease P protein component [Acidimicrobiia bacterium]
MSAPDDDKKRASDHQCSSAPRPQEAVGLIERLRGRSAFARLRADGVRVDHGLLWVRFLPDPSLAAARVAYALPRQVGSAVIRNTIRRRLREIVGGLDRGGAGGLPAGLYLIGAKRGAGQIPHADLRISLLTCLSKLERAGS